jgi:hypothetical protein
VVAGGAAAARGAADVGVVTRGAVGDVGAT